MAIMEELRKPIESINDNGEKETSNLMHELFGKGKTREELVQRTEKLLVLLMSMKVLTQEDRELIWKTTDMNDDGMKVETLKSLQGAAPTMDYEDRSFFM